MQKACRRTTFWSTCCFQKEGYSSPMFPWLPWWVEVNMPMDLLHTFKNSFLKAGFTALWTLSFMPIHSLQFHQSPQHSEDKQPELTQDMAGRMGVSRSTRLWFWLLTALLFSWVLSRLYLTSPLDILGPEVSLQFGRGSDFSGAPSANSSAATTQSLRPTQ